MYTSKPLQFQPKKYWNKFSNCINYKQLVYYNRRNNCQSRVIFRKKTTTCSITARWCIDVKFGMKGQAIESVTQWVQTVGVPESRIEMEVSFDSLAELEQFWQNISASMHKAWCEKAQSFIVDASPQWHVYRTQNPFNRQSVSISKEDGRIINDVTQEEFVSIGDSGLVVPVDSDIAFDSIGNGGVIVPVDSEKVKNKSQNKSVQKQENKDKDVVLDWKGEPMKINPGDKLPFKFQ
eukprot:TRINITY_DN6053_c0_g1_i4.p1 TRINITY_DN6053_c0_g1~~TRINITY_DN6053_c0_g1_i4.p1  ORF type:complete len:258 (+),score=26.15 TRINITY_DN6053_c0_g1_i4:69-776(+)